MFHSVLRVVDNAGRTERGRPVHCAEFEQQASRRAIYQGQGICGWALIGNNPVEALPILEIDLENDPDAIQTEDHKRTLPREKICPADIPAELACDMRDQSIAAFKELQLRDFSRVDIRMDKNKTDLHP